MSTLLHTRIAATVAVLALAATVVASTGASNGIRVAAARVASGTTLGRAVPGRLIGRWSRNVVASDWAKAGTDNHGVGVYTMIIKPGAIQFYYPTGRQPWFTANLSVTGGRLIVGPIVAFYNCGSQGVYRWKVVGRLLTIRKRADALCPPRVALLTGTWKTDVKRSLPRCWTSPLRRTDAVDRASRGYGRLLVGTNQQPIEERSCTHESTTPHSRSQAP